MKRTLMLTSPLMRGPDVAYAKRLLNNNPFDVFSPSLDIDGTASKWDQESAAAAREAKWFLGYKEADCTGTFGTTLEKYLRGDAQISLLMKRRRKARLNQSYGLRALSEAMKWVGTTERPAGSNIAKPFTEWYGWIGWGAPWCAVFVSWCYAKAGFNQIEPNKARWAYCPYFLADARARRYGLKEIRWDQVRPGDAVLFDWDDDGIADHIGLARGKVSAGAVETIEGNTSFSDWGDQSNGGAVALKTRRTSDIIAYVRVG